MSKARRFADGLRLAIASRPHDFRVSVGGSGERGLCVHATVTDDGWAHVGVAGNVVNIPPEGIEALARWLLEVFAADNEDWLQSHVIVPEGPGGDPYGVPLPPPG